MVNYYEKCLTGSCRPKVVPKVNSSEKCINTFVWMNCADLRPIVRQSRQ